MMPNLRLPAFVLPRPLAQLASRLPQQPPTQLLVLALNLALGPVLDRENLAPLQGRHLRLRVLDAGLTLDFSLGPERFQRHPGHATPDLCFSANTRDFIALALREEDADTLFFDRRLLLEGDTELGLLVKNTLDAIDWDAMRTLFNPLSARMRSAPPMA